MSDEPQEREDKPDAADAADERDERDEAGEADEASAAEPAKAKKVKAHKPPKPPKPPKQNKAKTNGFNRLLLLIPVAVIVALAVILGVPPTRAMLANGPLKPLFARFNHPPPVAAVAPAPKQSDRPADGKGLNDALQTDRSNAAAKDAQITRLQKQVTQLQARPTSTSAPAGKLAPAAISEGVKRAALYWAGMDADKAADIVKQLPDAYVKLVFSQMPPDAVSDIMSALPTKTAARLMPSGDPQTP